MQRKIADLKSILIIGSVALDSVETSFGKRESILGGSATYSSLSASFFNKNVNIVSVVGMDFPKRYLTLLKRKGINLDGLEVVGGRTFRWKGDYRRDLNSPKTIRTQLNVFADFNPVVPPSLRRSKYIFLANIDPDLQERVLSQVKNQQPQLANLFLLQCPIL